MKHLILAAALLAAPLTATAQTQNYGPIEVLDAWVKKPMKGDDTAAYMSVTNHGNMPVTLTGVASTGADKAELHAVNETDGRMSMRPESSVVIGAGQTVNFAPGGLHVMLYDLDGKPDLGKAVPLTLSFAELPAAVNVTATVKDPQGNRADTRVNSYSPKDIGFNRDKGASTPVKP